MLASLTDYNASLNAGLMQEFSVHKVGGTMQGAGTWMRLWTASGAPGAGAEPAATPGTAYSNATGGIIFGDSSPTTKQLVTIELASTQQCVVALYDRLVGVSGISLAATGAKTVNSTALTRYSGAAANVVEPWIEITTATTTTAAILSASSYTNESGTAARAGATVTLPAAATVLNATIRLPLQAGDRGVRSIESLNVATAAAAGVCNVVLRRRLGQLFIPTNGSSLLTLPVDRLGAPQVFDGATLELLVLPNATTATTIMGSITIGS